MFQKASRLKLRFDTGRGMASVEDLWDMPLIEKGRDQFSLDTLAKKLNREIKDSGDESFVTKKSTENEVLALKFEIVKHIIGVKLAENEVRINAAAIKAQQEKIKAIIARKEDATLENMDLEDLKKMVA